MGLFRRLFGGPEVSTTDVMRLDVLMDHTLSWGFGSAALRWTDPYEGGPPIQAHLVALLYGRILGVHAETREELFRRVDELAAQNIRSRGETGFEFAPWTLHVGLGGGDHRLWPWPIVEPSQIADAKTYTATLKVGQPNSRAPLGRWLHLDMCLGLERVLAPSSALIAIAAFSKGCDQQARYFLALLLWHMNAYWGSSDRVSIGSESMANSAADAAIRGSIQLS